MSHYNPDHEFMTSLEIQLERELEKTKAERDELRKALDGDERAGISIYRRAMTYEMNRNQKLREQLDYLLGVLEEVVRISDRKHETWDAAKTVIAKARQTLALDKRRSTL